MTAPDTLASLADELGELSERMREKADARDDEVEELRAEVADYETGERATQAEAWVAADALHRESHDAWPITSCRKDTCVALMDALAPGWREYRPPLVS